MKHRSLCLVALAALCIGTVASAAGVVKVGRGHYTTELRPGGEREAPATVFRSPEARGPVPTNQWHSSPMFASPSEPMYAQPASYRMTAQGFEIDTPVKQVVPDSTREENDIAYPHRALLTVQPLGFAVSQMRVHKSSDWAVDLTLGDGGRQLQVTVAHGSPFSFFTVTEGDIALRTAEAATVFHRSADGRALGLTVLDRAYGIYAPTGARWDTDAEGRTVLRLQHLPAARRYFSVAALPEGNAATVDAFSRHAYAFITDTEVSWRYDEARSTVTTSFLARTEVKEGPDHGTLFGLYPHQWHRNPLLGHVLPQGYDTVRGRLKLVAGTSFQTQYTYTGLLPKWPALPAGPAAAQLQKFLDRDTEFGPDDLLNSRPGGTYWEGKGLNRAAQVMAIAEQQGDTARRDALLAALKKRLETWFAPAEGAAKYFYYHQKLGTLIGYPDEFGSAEQLNDHHFHYGYWIFAAAQVALRDPAWAARENWGGMVETLIADIATTDRHSPMFPRLRPFDAYEGHAWASGTAPFFDGNNQESSSESLNAWAGMILWGEATGNTRIRDTGIYLYTTESQALNHYWFDLHKLVFAPEYENVDASMVWSNKYTHGTWFTDNPRMVHGINMLPITTASLYLGTDPAYIGRNLAAMDREFKAFLARDGKSPPDIWQDILLQYAALDDPAAALKRWDPEGAVEDGETRTHTYHWLQSLVGLGRPDFSITANTALYGVFRRADGQRTYLAYNAGQSPRSVRFSDGTTLQVPPGKLARVTAAAAVAK
jgi:endoglucanase Acf2